MNSWVCAIAILGVVSQANGDGINKKPKSTTSRPIELLKCKPAKVKPEMRAREAAEAANFSDHEVLARLILAEALATGYFTDRCQAPSSEVLMEALGWAVMNRVEKYSPHRDDPKPDAIFHVVFAPKQFSSSFSAAKDNPFAAIFLCPMDAEKYLDPEGKKTSGELYFKAKEITARILDQYQRTGIAPVYSKISHFFFPHSPFEGSARPSWAKDPDPTKNKGYVNALNSEKPCVEFYRR